MSIRGVAHPRQARRVVFRLLVIAGAFLLTANGVFALPSSTVSVGIELVRDVALGTEFEVGILFNEVDTDIVVGGFDLLLEYDPTPLAFLGADPGLVYDDCEWEYFTYRVGSDAECGRSPCAAGFVRLVGIADINDGPHHPTCHGEPASELARLHFRATNDQTYECQFIPLRWIWYDCADNALASVDGSVLFVSQAVYDFQGFPITANEPFPTYAGAPDTCVTQPSSAIRAVDFYQGGVDLLCSDSVEFRGDVNLNGVPYEVADWVLFSNYFLWGLEVFSINEEAQVSATDVNADDVPLTLDDLVYLWRIIIGDALPFPRPATPDTAFITQDVLAKTITVAYPDSLAAAYLIFQGDIVPELQAEGDLGLGYHFDGEYTRVLIVPPVLSDPPPVFEPGLLLTYTGVGQLQEAEVSRDGLMIIPTVIVIPDLLHGNTEEAPSPLYAYMAYSIEPIPMTIYLGDLDGAAVFDIDHNTLQVNEIEPVSVQVLPSHPGFTGEVLEISLTAGEFIRPYLPFYDSTDQIFVITGQFDDQSPLVVFGQAAMIGHISGDVNLDGTINVVDLTYLVEYLFQGGRPPRVLETADYNGDGAVDVVDVTGIARYLFG